MRIYTHAYEHYIERVLRLEYDQVGDSVMDFVEEQVRLAALDPEVTYQRSEEDFPMHIRNGCAVPVRDEGDKVVVPTAYNASTFLKKIDTNEPATVPG